MRKLTAKKSYLAMTLLESTGPLFSPCSSQKTLLPQYNGGEGLYWYYLHIIWMEIYLHFSMSSEDRGP